ncbi:MAG: hypothetical protein J2P48_14075 [Alphaproteobacteria bacterium]|nr:hypothetical protein [Alphaproteobacteria bacterium]
MAVFVEGRGIASEAEPVGLLTEGAAGIAVIILSVIALAGISPGTLASIATIILGVGLMAQAFNSAAENSKLAAAQPTAILDLGGETMFDSLCGIAGIVLGVLALVGISSAYLVSSALITFGGALLLSGVIGTPPKGAHAPALEGQTEARPYRGAAATGAVEILIGVAAIVLGILSLASMVSWVLVLVGFLVVGAGLLMVSATFSGTVMRFFTTTA